MFIIISSTVGNSSSILNTIMRHFLKKKYTMWGPIVRSWFITPISHIVISTINHKIHRIMCTNLSRAIVNGGPTLHPCTDELG